MGLKEWYTGLAKRLAQDRSISGSQAPEWFKASRGYQERAGLLAYHMREAEKLAGMLSDYEAPRPATVSEVLP